MKLKVQNPVDGPTYVALIDPSNEEHKKAVEVGPNQAVEIDLSTVTDPSQVSIGSVVDGTGEEAPAPADGEGAPAEGEGGGDQGGDQGEGAPAEGEGEAPSTTAASETALYLIEGDTIPEGFTPSGLETVDGKTLYHFSADTPGSDPGGNADGVSVFAEAGDNEQPVQPAAPAEGGAETPSA